METKVCIDCGIEKELYANFAMEGINGAFRRNKCKSCVRIWNTLPKEERDKIKADQKKVIVTRIEKICPTCNILQPRDAFYIARTKVDGMSTECRSCDDHRTQKYRSKLRSISIQGYTPVLTEQICKGCNELKDINQFSKDVTKKAGHLNKCKCCSRKYWQDRVTDESRVRWLLGRIRTKCNQLDILFDLELSDIIIPEVCPILGIPLVFGKSDKGYTSKASEGSPSIDRIDPDGGYIKGNVVIISWRANRIKGNATIDELIKLADFYKALGQ